eukprot:gene10426-13231_t
MAQSDERPERPEPNAPPHREVDLADQATFDRALAALLTLDERLPPLAALTGPLTLRRRAPDFAGLTGVV